MWNKLLDASIYYSFDKSGFIRHSKNFNDNYSFHSGSKALVTGGTSGIGKEVSLHLANGGVEVSVTGRDEEKGKVAENSHNKIHFISWDMANWAEIDKISSESNILDFVVLNAGGMPSKYSTNKHGIELQFASQLFGHYYLIKALKKKGKLKDSARIVWVTSGGMYLNLLNLNSIFENNNYDKLATYANVKRAQVTLLLHLKEEFSDYTVTAMHPGWVATPGVSEAIPAFEKKMGDRLRTPLQGADTILWLLGSTQSIESGKLYFDRKKVKSHFFWWTKKGDNLLTELVEILNKYKL
jgi:dehydrogenase/reductase SDR family member 12